MKILVGTHRFNVETFSLFVPIHVLPIIMKEHPNHTKNPVGLNKLILSFFYFVLRVCKLFQSIIQ